MGDQVLKQHPKKLGILRALVCKGGFAVALSTSFSLLPVQIAAATPVVPSGSPQLEPFSARSQPQLKTLLPAYIPELPPLGEADDFIPEPAPAAEVALVISLSDRKVHVYQQDQLQASFPIAIGRAGWETPTGEHRVLQMMRDPAWQNPFTGEVIPPGPRNPLGVRWIGFWTDGQNYIGFHGTPNEESVGRAASHGCIRMYNRDVVKLFEMVSIGTPVTVVP